MATRTMTRRDVFFRIAGACLFVAASNACKSPDISQSTSTEPATVRIGYTAIVASLPIFVAQQQKYFEAEGVRAETVSFGNSNDMVNALVAGRIDVLPAVSLVPLLHLEGQHPGTVRLFSHSRMRPSKAFDSIVVLRDSPLQDIGALADRKIGVFPGTSATNMLAAFLTRHGVKPDSVTLVPLAPTAQLTSLEAGAIDALFTYEPVTTVALRNGRHRKLFGSVYADLLDPNPIGASAVSRAFERDRPDAAHRVIAAIDKSVVYMREHPDDARSLLPRFVPVGPDIANAINLVDVTLSNENDLTSLQKFTDLLVEIGELRKPTTAASLVSPTK